MASVESIQNAVKASGLDPKTLNFIKEKAGSGVKMDSSTPQKQAVYDAYQQYYTSEVQKKAQAGQQLDSSNPWKDSIYAQFATPKSNNPQGVLSIDEYMKQAQGNSATQMQAMQGYLESMAQNQILGQQAQLGMAKEQQLAQIEQALQKAIADGQLSIRQAEQQFQEAKAGIYDQAYRDSEVTNLTAHDRGIQNSAQMIGLQQGDNARRDGLLNQNLTTRDRAINEINHQLAQIKYDTDINKSLANSQYNYGMIGAEAEINANMYNQMANMSFEEYQRMASQGFDLNKMGLQQGYDMDKLSVQQKYALEQMAKQQGYTQDNMNMQHGFDLSKLSVQQKYQLEQMAKQYGYDLNKMGVDQQYRLAQMAQSFGYDMSLQSSSQNFQAGQNALDRGAQVQLQQMRQSHDLSMLSAQQQAELDKYEVELGRKLAQYQPNTPENELLTKEYDWAINSMKRESTAQMANELGAKKLAQLMEQYPDLPKDMSNKKQVDEYNTRVESLNKQIEDIMDGSGFKYTMDKLEASKSYTKEEKNGFLEAIKAGIKTININPSSFFNTPLFPR